jgi:hypothetical protein
MNVEASDLLLEGVPATSVTPLGLGQFRFMFAPPARAWCMSRGRPITGSSSTGNALPAARDVCLDPNAVAQRALISEFMVANVSTLADEDEFPD